MTSHDHLRQGITGVATATGPFSQYFHHVKALYVQMMDLYLIFQGRCHDVIERQQ